MRINNYKILAAAAAVLFAACTDENTFGTDGYTPSLTEHYLHLSATAVTMPAEAATRQLSVTSMNTSWAVSGYDTKWLSFQDDYGWGTEDITLTTQANTVAEQRTSVFWFESADYDYSYRRQLSVTQQAAPAYITVSQTRLTFAPAGGDDYVTVSSNVNWQPTVSPANDWLTVSKSSDGRRLTFVAAANLTDADRTVTITLTGGDKPVSIVVTQTAPVDPSLSPAVTSTLAFTNSGGSYSLHVSSEVPWTASTSASWLEIYPDGGTGNYNSLTITAAPNTTTSDLAGNVYIFIGTQQRLTIPVTVERSHFAVSPRELVFGRDAQSLTLTTEGNIRWTVITKPSWLTVSPTGNYGNGMIQVSVPYYEADSDRTGTLTLGIAGTTLQQDIAVRQSCRYFELTPTVDASQPSRGGTHQVHIATNTSWTATTSSPWMQLSAYSGQRDIDVTMTAQDNPSVNARRDTTTFTPADFTPVSIVTTQQGRYLRVGAENLTFFTRGGTIAVTDIETDADITVASSDPSWLTVSQQGTTFTATAAENTTGAPRTATITIAMTGLNSGESYRIALPVTQHFSKQQIDIDTWGDDQQWDLVTASKATITVVGFTADRSWDDSDRAKLTVTITGYRNDQSWDDNSQADVNIGVANFPADKSWNDADQSKGNVTVTPYPADKPWDDSNQADVNIGVTTFPADKSWNDADQSKGTVTVTPYAADKKWD